MVLAAGWFGVVARNRTFTETANLRMWWDIANGFNHGKLVVENARDDTAMRRNVASLVKFLGGGEGTPQKLAWSTYFEAYLAHYDKVAARSRVRHDGVTRYNLDYAPLRLLIMSAWVKHTLDVYPDAQDYDDRFAWPLMHFNTAMAGLGAAAMFAVVFGWRRACDRFAAWQPANLAAQRARLATGTPPPIFSPFDRTFIVALLCAAILFLNPTTIFNSHGFVQWDTWILPFILGAMALGALERWGLAGALLGLSMGFKGQVMIVMPALLLWPIFGGHFLGAARFVIGFVLSVLMIGLPWLIPDETAWLWLGTTVAIGCLFAAQRSPARIGLTWWLAAGVATALVIGPYVNEQYVWRIWIPLSMMAAMILLPWILPRGNSGAVGGLIAIAAMIAAADRFGGSWNWFKISYLWPGNQYKQLFMGPTANLPAILAQFGWGIDSILTQAKLFGREWEITLRHGLIALNLVLCAICAAAAAIQQRRRDPMLLVALAAPWIVAFAVLPQMHERYLTWGAAIAGVGLAASVRWGLMQTVIIAVSFMMTLTQMMRMHSGDWPTALPTLSRLLPQVAWLLMMAMAVYVVGSFGRSRGWNNK